MTLRLRTLLGDHPGTSALKDGSLRSRGQAGRHPFLHHHDRRVAARHSRQRAWRRSRCDRLGDVRGRACRGVCRHHGARAGGKQIIQMLLDGELDAVLGEKVERPGLKPLFPDVAAEEKSWFAKYGVLPINHMVVVSQELADHHPDEVREVFRLLRERPRAGRRRGAAVQRNAPLAGDDHSLRRAAAAHSASLCGGGTVRRLDFSARGNP